MKRRSHIRPALISFLVLAMVPLTAAGPAAARATAPVVRQAVRHDTSAALRSVTPIVAETTGTRQVPRPGAAPAAMQAEQGLDVLDPVVQSSVPSARMPAPTTSFDGIGATGYLPPDTNADVGPSHIVETVNSAFQIFNKSGTSLYGPADISTVFAGMGGTGCAVTNDGDPIVLYDAVANRWLISQFSLPSYPNPPFYQCIAISTTGDPTGSWYRYEFNMGSYMNDYGKFGIWSDGYYMTDNEFNSSGSYVGVGVWVFERARMLLGLSASSQYFHLTTAYFSLLPGDIDGSTPPPAGAPNPIVGFEDNVGTDYIDTWAFDVDWVTPANTTLTGPTQLAAASFDTNLCGYARSCIPQPGTAVGLDSLAGFMMYRLAYRNLGSYQSLVLNFSVDANGGDHAGIRWTELRKTSGAWSIAQQGTYAPDSDHRWMGSIAQDQDGNIALGYSVSSGATYPSIRYAGRLAGDPAGVMSQGEAVLQAGAGSQTSSSNRWGDYSSMSVDPSDDCTFWYANEYYSATSAGGWKTRIGSFKFPTCGTAPATHTLTTSVVGSGTVTSVPGVISCPGTCTDDFTDGTSVDLTATPGAGWSFSSWSGDCSGTTNPCNVSMTAARNVTATFTASTSTTTSGQLMGYYGTKGGFRLYHLRSKAYYKMTVSPNLAGNSASIDLYKWTKSSASWVYQTTASGTLDAGSTLTAFAKGRYWGRGKYAIRGAFPGFGVYLPSEAPWLYFRFTR